MRRLMHNKAAWINIQRPHSKACMHLNFSFRQAKAILSEKASLQLTDSLSAPQRASEQFIMHHCSVITHSVARENINRLVGEGEVLISLSADNWSAHPREHFCCERSCGKLIFMRVGASASQLTKQRHATPSALWESFLSGKIVLCEIQAPLGANL